MKEAGPEADFRERGIRGILLDIEGTTTPISFVYDVLFPYARARLDEAAERAASDPELGEAFAALGEEHAAERQRGNLDIPAFGNGAPYARYLMDSDRKSTALKRLQGILWRAGYADGSLQGAVYPDVPPALVAWREAGMRMRIFSSGSVLAQKLLFSSTPHGDLTPYFEGFHDTTTGPKKVAASYETIAGSFALPPGSVLFLSDVVAELDAARDAGMATGLLERPGNAPVPKGIVHPRYHDFGVLR